MIKPANPRKFIDELNYTLSTISMGISINYVEHRDLVQIWKGSAHGDLWFYTLDKSNMLMSNYDYTTRVNQLDYTRYFPTQYIKWQHIDVPMPKEEKYAAQLEFGNNFMTPQYHRFQCLENIVTNKISKCRMTVYFIMIISGNVVAILITHLWSKRSFRRSLRRNANSIIFASVPGNIGDKLMRIMSRMSQETDSMDVSLNEIGLTEREGLLDSSSESETTKRRADTERAALTVSETVENC